MRVPAGSNAPREAAGLGNAVIALTIVRNDQGSFTDFRVEAVNESAAMALGIDP